MNQDVNISIVYLELNVPVHVVNVVVLVLDVAVPDSRCGSFFLQDSVKRLDFSPTESWRFSHHQELLLD